MTAQPNAGPVSPLPATHPHATGRCPNCAAESSGDYCSGCGQKALHDGDLSLAHAWHHLVHETLHLDGRIFATLKLLFMRPGQLTLDFLEGRRARHVHPLRVFLVFSALFFLAQAQPLSPKGMIHGTPGRAARETMKQRAAQGGPAYELQLQALDRRMHTTFKIAFISSVVVSGLGLFYLFRRKRPYLAEHMVTALHIWSVTMALSVAFGLVGHWLDREAVAAGLAAGVAAVFAFASLQRVYGRDDPARRLLPAVLLFSIGNMAIVLLACLAVLWTV